MNFDLEQQRKSYSDAGTELEDLAKTVGGVGVLLEGAENGLRTSATDLAHAVRGNDTKEPPALYGLTETRTALKTSIRELTDVLNRYSALFPSLSDSDF